MEKNCIICAFFSINGKDYPINTSCSVKPNASVYWSEVVLTTLRLFKSENIDSLDTRVIPVINARSSELFVLNVA